MAIITLPNSDMIVETRGLDAEEEDLVRELVSLMTADELLSMALEWPGDADREAETGGAAPAAQAGGKWTD